MTRPPYVTKQGDTVDLACLHTYGVTKDVTELTLAHNPGLAAKGEKLPIGTVIHMPDPPAEKAEPDLPPLW